LTNLRVLSKLSNELAGANPGRRHGSVRPVRLSARLDGPGRGSSGSDAPGGLSSFQEALFRAAVEALHDGALEAAAAAGAAAEQAGRSVADVLAVQIDAKMRYVIECLEETSQVEELLSERQHQARDLNQSFHEQIVALQVATIARICKAQGLALRDNMTARDLARSIQFAISGAHEVKLDAAAIDDLARVVRLIVQGAIAPTSLTRRPAKTSRAPHKRRSRKLGKSRSSR
jgi:hypothetical protein